VEKRRKKKLLEKISNLPSGPGVYLFRDQEGRIIYIGKAVSLRNRVRWYLSKESFSEPKTTALVNEIVDLEFYPTRTEAEAFFLESRFVKTYQPRYNVELRDDKTFPFLRITRERFPRIEIIRGKKEGKDYYFGPFTQVWALKRALRNLRQIFPLASCRRTFSTEKKARPCLDHSLKRCLAPCAHLVSEEEYNQTARATLAYFRGRGGRIISELRSEMVKAAAELDFERAARLRDEIEALRRVRMHPKSLGKERPSARIILNLKDALGLPKEPVRVEGFDISNLFGSEAVGSRVVFLAGEPYPKEYKRFRIKGVEGIDDCAMLAEVFRRRILEKDWPLPDLFLVDGGRPQVETISKIFQKEGILTPLVGIAKEEEKFYLPGRKEPLSLSPATPEGLFLRRVRDEAHRFAVSYHHHLSRRKMSASVLDNIPGIGPKRKALLWQRYRSLNEMGRASIQELKTLGIPEEVALRLKSLLGPTLKGGCQI